MYGILLVMIDATEVPEFAISAFERVSGLSVCIYDYSRTLWAYLPPQRFEHLNPHCTTVKTVRIASCLAFEATPLREALLQKPDGLVKVCHAGFVEFVVPLIEAGELRWVLFAGVRRPTAGLKNILADSSKLARSGPWSAPLAKLSAVDDDEAAWTLENLRQLNQRLVAWHGNLVPGEPGELPRGIIVRRYIVQHHTRAGFCLADLAKELRLSESRTGHVVRNACGQTFIELLTDLRLRTAAGLLRHTGLPLIRIIAASGFRNRAHFHQVFRRVFGISPGRYRARTVASPTTERSSSLPKSNATR
jgi:AraC-like DNA-binding protein